MLCSKQFASFWKHLSPDRAIIYPSKHCSHLSAKGLKISHDWMLLLVFLSKQDELAEKYPWKHFLQKVVFFVPSYSSQFSMSCTVVHNVADSKKNLF